MKKKEEEKQNHHARQMMDYFASIRMSQVIKDYRSTEIVFNRISRQLEL
jgi:hypothetical protein